MSYMFYGCKSLINIDLSNFNTKNVRNMSYMFYGCNSLTNIDLSNFNFINIIHAYLIYHMFSECNSLTYINLSNSNTQNDTNMSYMFYGCNSLILSFLFH